MPITQNAFDNRKFSNGDPIARGAVQTFAIVSGTTETKSVNINGQLLGYIYTIPNLTTDTTWTIEWLDLDGTVLYTKSDLADNKPTTPFYIAMDLTDPTELIYLFGGHQIRVTYTTSQTATIVVVPIYK